MSLAEKKISSVILGRISPFTVENLRIIREFFGVTFKIEAIESKKKNTNETDQEMEEDDDEN